MYVKVSTDDTIWMSVSFFMQIEVVLTEAAQEKSPSFHRILTIYGGEQPLVSSARHHKSEIFNFFEHE